MQTKDFLHIEQTFSALPAVEREFIIRHGVALRIVDLQKRLTLAEGKLRSFAERYRTTLEELETSGLPDDASVDMHEDYIMWRHWQATADQIRQDIVTLEKIGRFGLSGEISDHASD